MTNVREAGGQSRDPGQGGEPELSYERARAELASVVERLESGAGTLEESLALWERGETLATICQRWLDDAAARLESARAARSRETRLRVASSEPETSSRPQHPVEG